jgi:fumarylacetoacetase
VVTLDALSPFRTSAAERASGDPAPLPYLADERNGREGAIDITLEVYLSSATMREKGLSHVRLSRARFSQMYWTLGQLVTHHTINGCNLRPGDLLASGTVSGAANDSWGSLLERAWRGTQPIELPTGERRSFLEDGDEVVMRAYCERDGYRRIGFGECRGTIMGSV